MIAGFFAALLIGLRHERQLVGWSAESTTLRAAVFVWLCMTPFGLVLEDKGFALSLMLLITLYTARLRAFSEQAADQAGHDDRQLALVS